MTDVNNRSAQTDSRAADAAATLELSRDNGSSSAATRSNARNDGASSSPSISGTSSEGGFDLKRPIDLVFGTGPEMTAETRVLLHCRLRLSALVLFAGFGMFLLRSLIWTETREPSAALFVLHLVVTAVLGIAGFTLCRNCQVSTLRLRIQEVVVFGLPAIFLLCIQYKEMIRCAGDGFLPSPTSSWMLIMFTYAFLIPNQWMRASAVIGSMATASIGMTLWLMSTNPLCRAAANANFTYASTQALSLVLASIVAIVGVRTIRLLRSEVFEAKQFGHYRLKQLIGRGAMGDVYLAEHQLMRRPCAIKIIQADRAGDPRALARFEREVRSIAGLSHWNSVDIFDYGRASDGTFYYVMEYLPGLSVQELVDGFGPLDSQRAIYLLRQMCDALNEAHEQGLVHRDIKPANIFAAVRGGRHDVAKILDFGLAKPVLQTSVEDESVEVTQEGMITGSPLYMSPEQAMGEVEPDHRSDIYSLGAVAYFMLTGRPPFEGDKPLRVILAHAHDELVSPRVYQPTLEPKLASIVERCLAKRPEDRFQSVEAISDALEELERPGGWNERLARAWWLQHKGAAESSKPEKEVPVHTLTA